jgi:hypothetical protein
MASPDYSHYIATRIINNAIPLIMQRYQFHQPAHDSVLPALENGGLHLLTLPLDHHGCMPSSNDCGEPHGWDNALGFKNV